MSSPSLPPFHLAFPIKSIADTRAFYIGILGCDEGRSTEAWIDFDFFGHQLSAHVRPEAVRTRGPGMSMAMRCQSRISVRFWNGKNGTNWPTSLKQPMSNSCWNPKSALRANRVNRAPSLLKIRQEMALNSRHFAIRP